ncbi:MAG: hypothetical protein QM479_10845 [Pseudomonadota bacterium]
MLYVSLNEVDAIAILEPDGKLSENDFKSAAKIIDGYTEKSDKLNLENAVKIPYADTVEEIEALLPWNYKKSHTE